MERCRVEWFTVISTTRNDREDFGSTRIFSHQNTRHWTNSPFEDEVREVLW